MRGKRATQTIGKGGQATTKLTYSRQGSKTSYTTTTRKVPDVNILAFGGTIAFIIILAISGFIVVVSTYWNTRGYGYIATPDGNFPNFAGDDGSQAYDRYMEVIHATGSGMYNNLKAIFQSVMDAMGSVVNAFHQFEDFILNFFTQIGMFFENVGKFFGWIPAEGGGYTSTEPGWQTTAETASLIIQYFSSIGGNFL